MDLLLTERRHTATQIPQRNQHYSFLHFLKLGTTVCADARSPVITGCSQHSLGRVQATCFTISPRDSFPPLRKLRFWHFNAGFAVKFKRTKSKC